MFPTLIALYAVITLVTRICHSLIHGVLQLPGPRLRSTSETRRPTTFYTLVRQGPCDVVVLSILSFPFAANTPPRRCS
ncbi:hypothetical protein B0H12DRAFT_353373 [Mycena haematopus]|nr:hypothetical protein B0H12DRAFT_353373 [Mycena haematopus]